jgi:hypothetical protein
MNALLELDEDDPNRFYSSGGLKNALEEIQSVFFLIFLLVIFIFIWVCVFLWGCLTQNKLVKFIFSSHI